MKPVKVYPNECVERVIAFIPPNHIHLRLIIELPDQIIVLHEATVANIVRAYINVITHPSRRAIELVRTSIPKKARKPMYAEHQLVETEESEDAIISKGIKILEEGFVVCDEKGPTTDKVMNRNPSENR